MAAGTVAADATCRRTADERMCRTEHSGVEFVCVGRRPVPASGKYSVNRCGTAEHSRIGDEGRVRYGVIRHGKLGWTAADLLAGNHHTPHRRRRPDGVPLV